ncbi:rho GTPase-activating protein 29 isoform X1 [Bufo gargarizans]|uniref:rho GTPase-activating protein 29 isoform X1 n=2 Tax=Bufo gargarizans TaxID=30331 RepID=UPI001CF5C2BE|nr:rho GTPase-activating protein 29 isoform X1 [Bufo gargarizans]
MLRQNGGGNRRGLGFSRFSTSNFFTISNSATWGMGRSTKSNSLSSISTNSDCYDSSVVDPEYIMQLVNDVRRFADVLLYLKEACVSPENQDSLHQVVHERLGDLLRVLKGVISKHQTLNSVDILGAAGTVIAKVKAVNFKDINEENRREQFGEIFTSIDTLAFTFGNVVSDFLMGDVDNGSSLGLHSSRRSRSFENVSMEDSPGSIHERDDLQGHLRAEEVDSMLLRIDSGVESALSYAKAWSKYAKDILAWVEKRLNMEAEAARNLAKMAEAAKSIVAPQEFMPFQPIFTTAFQNDIECSQLWLQTISALQSNKFLQPLQARRSELDRQRREMKELWQREQKKMEELETALRKAKLLNVQRQDEHEKAKSSTVRAEEEQLSLSGGLLKDGNKQVEKRRRLEQEALQKAEEAKEHYKACVAEVEEKRIDMENVKSEILTQIRELVYQCDLTLKAATVNLFQLQHAQVVSLPVNCQTLCEIAKRYEPGQQYSEFVKNLPKDDCGIEVGSHAQIGRLMSKGDENSTRASHGNLSQGSAEYPPQSPEDMGSPFYNRSQKIGQKRSSSSTDIQAIRGPPFRSWSTGNQSGGMCSDSESAGGSSESRSMDSPSASPGDFKRRLPRTPSTGTMSSADDLDEREPPSPSDNGLNDLVSEIANSPGPFRNTIMSKASQTHKLRKLRAPSKCRECDSLVVFHGAECEECSLACHKKCLETLAIQCGHKKLHGRLHLFGVEFTQAAKNAPDGIPFIIKKCTSEIESRALSTKGIYRVNGAKSRVEKLCQAFENGKDLVELSDLYPHDISNVLKLYLRQLPEPLMVFSFYNELIGLAKESQRAIDEVDSKASSPPLKRQPSGVELNRVIFKIKDLLKRLPPPNYKTLQFLVGHLHRVTEEVEENKMTASNLGIIFGPTLLRPRQTDATVSLSSLVDYPYQARIVELLISHYDKIFDVSRQMINSEDREQQQQQHLRKVQSLPVGNESVMPSKRTNSLDDASFDFKGVEERLIRSQSVDIVEENEINVSESEERDSSEAGSPVVTLRGSDEQDCSMDAISEGDVAARRSSSEDLSNTNIPVPVKSYRQVAKVLLRAPRTKPVVRPVSLPVDRLPPSVLNENSRNVGVTLSDKLGNSPIIEEVSENKSLPTINSCHRLSCYDSQSNRKTWDKQYKQYDITPRTAMIMTNVPQEIRALDSGPTSLPSSTNCVSATLPKIPSTTQLKPITTDNNSTEPNVLSIYRAPRTLQPPPGTFYKPPSYKTKPSEETSQSDSSSASLMKAQCQININNVNLIVDSDLTTDLQGQGKNSQKPTPEDSPQTDVKPTFPRLRPKRVQELEHREAHFV